MRIRAFLAAVSFIPSPATAAEPIHLFPSSGWVVDYAENSCRLVRAFGEGKNLTTLALESEAPGFVDMLIIGRPLFTASNAVEAKFVPIESESMRGVVGFATEKDIPSILINSVRFVDKEGLAAEKSREADIKAHPDIRPPAVSVAEQEARRAERQAFATNTTGIEIDIRSRPVILETGSLGDAIKAFDQCSRDSLRDWGIDPDVEDKIVRPVWAPNWRKWFSPTDYPMDMLAHLKESTVKARLLVDATGRVTKCTSLSHYNEPEFNRITCSAFMARARFEPAELADGTKVPSYYVNNVVFRIAP